MNISEHLNNESDLIILFQRLGLSMQSIKGKRNPILFPSYSNHNPNLNAPKPNNSYRNHRAAPGWRYRRKHHPPPQRQAQEKSITIPPPFPWATDRRATVHSREYLLQKNIYSIAGMVHCTACKRTFNMRFDLEEQLDELRKFVQKEGEKMRGMAPAAWVKPRLPKCQYCGRKSAYPIIEWKKKAINWLFLLLGQMVGCCTDKQLKYFCKHNNDRQRGDKRRLLYRTYMSLCKQLDPEGFNSSSR